MKDSCGVTYDIKKYYLSFVISFIFGILHPIKTFFKTPLGVFHGGA